MLLLINNMLSGEFIEKLFRHIGFVRLDNTSVWEVFYWLTPEFIVLPTILTIYFLCRFLTQKRVNNEEDNAPLQQETNSQEKNMKDPTAKVISF